MSDFLNEMASSSRARVVTAMQREPLAALRARALATPPPPPLQLAVNGFDIIAEIKPSSPARGALTANGRMSAAEARARAASYATAGACAISVLTEPARFGGGIDLLEAAAKGSVAPVMRKDFLVDPYQLFEARACGASGVLLIVRMLGDELLGELADAAREAQLFVLWETFDAVDLGRLEAVRENTPRPRLAGLNARDLVTLQVDIERLSRLAGQFPVEFLRVAESGLSTPEDAARWAACGYRAALVGEALMRAEDSAALLRSMLAAGRAATKWSD